MFFKKRNKKQGLPKRKIWGKKGGKRVAETRRRFFSVNLEAGGREAGRKQRKKEKGKGGQRSDSLVHAVLIPQGASAEKEGKGRGSRENVKGRVREIAFLLFH